MEEVETKKCTKCKTDKPLRYFSKAKKGDKSRFVRLCKSCRAELRTPEAINARMRTKSGKEGWLRSVMLGLNGRDY